MFFVLFALWLIFNARLTLDVIVVGIIMSALLTLFGRKFCRWSAKTDRAAFHLSWSGIKYVALLFVEIIKANIAVIKIILSPRIDAVHPILFFFDTKLKTNVAKTTLANSITLTPGTYTIGLYDSTFAVHALNESFAEGTVDSLFNQQLCTLEQPEQEEDK